MKSKFFLILCLTASPLWAQPQSVRPYVLPPLANHPNVIPPNPSVAPPPNPQNPYPSSYDPYQSRADQPGAVFSGANAAAMHFLNIMDNQAFSGAWLDSGDIVHDVISQEVWAAGHRAVRMHKGPVMSRRVVSHRAVSTLPGGLTGQFMIINYETRFAGGAYETESLTVMSHPPLGVWRVINYRIEH